MKVLHPEGLCRIRIQPGPDTRRTFRSRKPASSAAGEGRRPAPAAGSRDLAGCQLERWTDKYVEE